MKEEVSEVRGYITSIEPIVRKGLLSYRARIISLGDESWKIYLRDIPKDFKLGLFVKVKTILSKQTDEEKLIADELKILEDVQRLKIEECTIEEVSRDKIPVVTGLRSGRFFSLPITDEDVLNKIPRILPAKVIALFMETPRGIKLASIVSEKEYKILMRMEELLTSIEENEKRLEELCREQLKLLEYC